ncbi:50S ribosomal protein L15 [Candidatus Endomicrobiellum devescovinae]|uniref:50S ribosomal protein L15 n=1 Tax=Candidatus Endomicrobiellum devescovinae TaxID=3242322 RepID=UPI00281BE51E|nr:50S ribosomal protein L15 [Endomicrobium sp.]MDR1434128.1 50S ribosomal protein L15 [Endomicrobium sp.]MDR2427388.1 50S ribosomal protein L15 [Endomicrobium sp.]MDR2817851.1 50S ribosomal protein L15 [Endomicrobium sp.]
MGLNNLKPAKGSKHRKKIVGRGVGSGHGRTSTRGSKGQKARSGDGSKKIGFEGGQMPIFRRIPKRGFNNPFRKEYEIVNVESLNKFDSGLEVTPQVLKEAGLIGKANLVKILGVGELKKALTVKVAAFSKSAVEKINAAGGKTEIVK